MLRIAFWAWEPEYSSPVYARKYLIYLELFTALAFNMKSS